MIDETERQQTVSMLYHIKLMVEDGSLEVEWLYKALVIAAYDLARAEEIHSAVETLHEVDPSYYAEPMQGHMAADPAFASQAMALATLLTQKGVVYLGFNEDERKIAGKA